jgi:hypothetical protein
LPHLKDAGNTSKSTMSINEQILGKYVSDGEAWCFGVFCKNFSGGALTVYQQISLRITKFGTNTDVFRPDRS